MSEQRPENTGPSEPARTDQYPGERFYPYAPPDDEISLFDIWDALVRQRWLIIGVAAAVTLVALAYALTRPDVYRYQVSLQIGETLVQSSDGSAQREPIASPAATTEALQSSVIPTTLREVLGLAPETVAAGGADIPDVNVESPQDSGIVHIRTEGPQAKAETYREILRAVAGRLVRDHAGVLETERLRQSRRLDQLASERKRIQQELESIDSRIERLTGSDAGASSAGALRLDALQQRASELETRLREIASERDRLNASLEALREHESVFTEDFDAQAVERQRQASREIAALSGGMRPTRVIAAPERSLQQVGTSGKLILALGIVLGGMLGVFAAFFAEFLAAARRRRESAEDR